MVVEEIISGLVKKMEMKMEISVDELRNIVMNISVEDKIAEDGALTVLYSGEDSGLMKSLSEKAGSKVRMIDHTEASKLLTDSKFESILNFEWKCEKCKRLLRPMFYTENVLINNSKDGILHI